MEEDRPIHRRGPYGDSEAAIRSVSRVHMVSSNAQPEPTDARVLKRRVGDVGATSTAGRVLAVASAPDCPLGARYAFTDNRPETASIDSRPQWIYGAEHDEADRRDEGGPCRSGAARA